MNALSCSFVLKDIQNCDLGGIESAESLMRAETLQISIRKNNTVMLTLDAYSFTLKKAKTPLKEKKDGPVAIRFRLESKDLGFSNVELQINYHASGKLKTISATLINDNNVVLHRIDVHSNVNDFLVALAQRISTAMNQATRRAPVNPPAPTATPTPVMQANTSVPKAPSPSNTIQTAPATNIRVVNMDSRNAAREEEEPSTCLCDAIVCLVTAPFKMLSCILCGIVDCIDENSSHLQPYTDTDKRIDQAHAERYRDLGTSSAANRRH